MLVECTKVDLKLLSIVPLVLTYLWIVTHLPQKNMAFCSHMGYENSTISLVG